MYTGEDDKSHFEDFEVPFGTSSIGSVSGYLPVTRMRFRRRDADLPVGRLNVPERQFAVVVAGSVEVEVSDGVRRRFGPGDVLFAEDTTGEGHIARVDGYVEQVYIAVAVDFDVQAWIGALTTPAVEQ
jgi:hypothetical protein